MSATSKLYSAARLSALMRAIGKGPWFLLKRSVRIFLWVKWMRLLPRWPR